ncbi:hypothetical protein BDV98DRAFT_581684 [Pterulicium gracile]|uniref:Uncharacterized protein n=1 Tax=Pterulicium gracile TaxID=1884261 RepID=A0A5C3QMQ4_9AGAR|nr:hypothetical protein BDV98DRAFT_581684 [Pterula gracilis]
MLCFTSVALRALLLATKSLGEDNLPAACQSCSTGLNLMLLAHDFFTLNLACLAICEECLFASAEAPEGATIEESQTALNGIQILTDGVRAALGVFCEESGDKIRVPIIEVELEGELEGQDGEGGADESRGDV